jgi:hypothetical protein
MVPVFCRNCGAMNLFTGPPPARVKCDSCGNHFRTDQGSGSPRARPKRSHGCDPGAHDLDNLDDFLESVPDGDVGSRFVPVPAYSDTVDSGMSSGGKRALAGCLVLVLALVGLGIFAMGR